MAPCNGTQQRPPSTPPKLVVTLPPNHSTLQWHPAMAPSNGTLQWHPATSTVHSPKWHPAMAPSNVHRPLPQSWSSPSPQTIAHYSGTLQWHHVLLQSWSSPSPRNDSALQWHLAMAPSNGTTSTPPKLVVTLSPKHSTLQWHPTMAQPWHYVLCTLQWHPGATSNPPKWFVALPPYWK